MPSYTHSVAIHRDVDSVWQALTAVRDFPRFMPGVDSVTPVGGGVGLDRWHWVMRDQEGMRDFLTVTTENRPRQCLAWCPVDDPESRTLVLLSALGTARTLVTLRVNVSAHGLEGCLAGTLSDLATVVRTTLRRFGRLLEEDGEETPGGGHLSRPRPLDAMYPVEASHLGDDPANPLELPFPPRVSSRGRAVRDRDSERRAAPPSGSRPVASGRRRPGVRPASS